ncbi:MAG: hypothetical protein C0625_08055 [Arcobacter sp.]|nr:MAG: hypothetical protein C0625_08055 [Arcobacter sp.]
MDNNLAVDTKDKKMYEAYERMTANVDSFERFEEFYNYFLKQVTTEDKEKLNKWLLKVLFVELKRKHPFDELIDLVDSDEKETLKIWLDSSLGKLKRRIDD